MTDRIAEIRARRCMTDSEIIRAALTDDGALAALDRLDASVERLREAIDKARHELGVPSGDYPAPIANAYDILLAALHPDSGEAK